MSMMELTNRIDALIGANSGRPKQGNTFSITLAEVKDINDKDKLNRVKCLPIGSKAGEETDWCYVMTPMSGPERGLFLFPQVGDLVVLGFLENDPHRPIVLGGFWAAASKPPIAVSDGKAEDYCLKTPHKVDFTLHDEDSKQKLTLTMPSGTVLEIDDDKQTVTTKNKAGDTSMLMKMKDGEIEFKAQKKLTITVGNATLTMEQSGNITIKGTGGNISIEGNNFSGKAQAQLGLEGADVSMKSNGNLAINATATASVKGMLLQLN